jgi:hypothetical protein
MTTVTIPCEHCHEQWDIDEMRADHNGDRTCPDCIATFADHNDHHDYIAYAYH